jgi:type 1 glutamine amidotransferase
MHPAKFRRLPPHDTSMKKLFTTLLTFALAATSALAAEPKRVIVCTATLGFRHGSIPFAEKTLQKLADESKAYVIVDWVKQPKSPDMDKLSPANLEAQKIDMVIFANTTGELPLPDKEGFIKWIEAGHAFSAMHSGSDTLHNFPGFREMLQGEFKTHGDQTPADLIAGDKAHPANGGLGDTWDIKQEEMYLFKEGTHDRAKVRELWYMRHAPMNKNKEEFVPVSWCRMAGKGRVFYTSLGHREDLWDETDAVKDRINPPAISKQYQAHILGGMKWALGLAEGSATPNPESK